MLNKEMVKNGNTIYFDMDGTIADFYNFPGWLSLLQAESCEPYERAAPMKELHLIVKQLEKLQKNNYKIGIISWTSKGGSKQYNKAVRKAKIKWLKENFPLQLDEIHIVKYGVRKDYIAKDKYGILFDDNEEVRNKWRGRSFNERNILKTLKGLE